MTLKTQHSPTKLLITQTQIPARGRRRNPLSVALLGVESTPGVMDTTVLRGLPLDLLVMHAAEEGFDPSEALGVGLNALKIDRAKALSPSLVAQVAERLHIQDATRARLTAMHISKMAKQSGRSAADIISALELTAPL